MKTSTFLTLVLALSFLDAMKQHAFAQDYIPIFTRDYASRLSLEIDPVTYLYKGYSFHLRYQPMFSERFLIGAGTYGMDLPETFVDMNSLNRDKGWNVRIRSAYFLYGELYAGKANHRWFIGEQVGFQRFMVSSDQEARRFARFNNLLLLTYVGYSWHPYKGSFYIKPWAGVGYTTKVDGINTVGTMAYDISPIFFFFTFHVGYGF